MEYSTVVVQIICLFLVVRSGESTKCYLCNTAVNSKCGDPFNADNSIQPVECTPDSLKMVSESVENINNQLKDFGIDTTTVFKNIGLDKFLQATPDITKAVCQKVDITAKDKTTTIRTCSMPKSNAVDTCADFKKVWETSNDVKVACDYCDSDGCNAASGITSGSLLVSVLAAICLTAIFKAY